MCENKTVTLHHPEGQERVFTRIDSIKLYSGWNYITHPVYVIKGRCTWGERCVDGHTIAHVTESPAETTRRARAVWPDFDCEGAVPRLQPTVTLHGLYGVERKCYRIDMIADGGCSTTVVGQFHTLDEGAPAPSGNVIYERVIILESVPEITEKARAAWGEDWSCPGAEPPVVVLPLHAPFPGMDGIPAPYPDGCVRLSRVRDIRVVGNVVCVDGNRVGNGIFGTWWLGIPLPDVVALCAAAGVPCCETEEKPPTVVLHGASGQGYEYRSIENIDGNITSDIIGSWRYPDIPGRGKWNDHSGPQPVTESPAEITRRFRKVFGDDWSCPGCDKPVVVLAPVYEKCTYRFSEITAIDPAEGDAYVTGERADDGVWVVKLRVDKTAADIRAACAAAGVPCPPEETLTSTSGYSDVRAWRSVTAECDSLQAQCDSQNEQLFEAHERVEELEGELAQNDEQWRRVVEQWQDMTKKARERVAELEAQLQAARGQTNDVFEENRRLKEQHAVEWLKLRNERDDAIRDKRVWYSRWEEYRDEAGEHRRQMEVLKREVAEAQAEATAMREERDALQAQRDALDEKYQMFKRSCLYTERCRWIAGNDLSQRIADVDGGSAERIWYEARARAAGQIEALIAEAKGDCDE